MQLDIYVNYRGTCEEAFRFYAQHLDGKIAGRSWLVLAWRCFC